MSSVYSGRSSILKMYAPSERDKVKNAIINKVRFDMPKLKGLREAVDEVCELNNYQPLNEFVCFIRGDTQLTDIEFIRIMTDARQMVHKLSPKFTNLVEALLALPWAKRNTEAIEAYTEFFIDVMVAHSKYVSFGVNILIALWIPADNDAELWPNGSPEPETTIHIELKVIHKLLERILNAIPMTFDLLLDSLDQKFPYYKKAPHVVAGYVHNLLWLIGYKSIYTEFVVQLLLKKLVLLDVNAPRGEIEETECDEAEEESETDMNTLRECMDDAEEPIFEMDDIEKEALPMNHPIAHTLDICMVKICQFLAEKNDTKLTKSLPSNGYEKLERHSQSMQFLKILIKAFDDVILPSHNTHHVQFLLFYYCSFRSSLAETFLASLWEKFTNLNVSAVIRQAAVGYIASFLARAKFLSIVVVRHYLKELAYWAHLYIERCDQFRANGSLKANLVFFCVCQAIFYVISFRSRDLTVDKRSLLFLQTLHLSALVTCNLNPLRVCLPAVATAFAGVTRAYQLAYCHAILERNARRKLATVYANDTATPEETLDTFFPFDPCLLKITSAVIAPHYLQYQASEAEEQTGIILSVSNGETKPAAGRKRGDSEMFDDVDDFLVADKRQKLLHIAKSEEREEQFTYGLSPGFHL